MAVTVDGNRRSWVAGANLVAQQYRIAVLNTQGVIVLAASATDKFIGVIMNKPVLGDQADICLRSAAGTGKVVAGATIAVGDRLTSNAAAAAIPTTTAGNEILGIALSAAAAGEVVEYLPANDRV